jgi:anti-sigma factor RsiW
MDTCRDIELELVAYCSGELDPADRDLVGLHLDGCASCREELARETRLRSTLGKMPAQACPEILVSRIEAAAAPLGSVAAIPRQRSRWLPTLAFAAAAGLALVLLLPASGPQQEWTEQEIAAVLDKTVSALKVQIHRARKSLRMVLTAPSEPGLDFKRETG